MKELHSHYADRAMRTSREIAVAIVLTLAGALLLSATLPWGESNTAVVKRETGVEDAAN